MTLPYDKTSKWSILEYSKQLLGKTLEEAVAPQVIEEGKYGKGSLGQLVQKYFFYQDINSNPDADFQEAGMELKCTPLKTLVNKTLAIKERLSLTMINYTEDQKKSFEESHVYMKCMYMLIIFYLHAANVPAHQLSILYSILWKIPEKDLLIMKEDYEIIINKIKSGKAHELSEGDTKYLGASRKGNTGDKEQWYTLPNGGKPERPAPKRGFSFKMQYMRTILEFIQKYGGHGTHNIVREIEDCGPQLVSKQELESKTFEEILLDRFVPFYGKSYSEICQIIGMKETNAKQKYAMATNGIITENKKRGKDANKSDEFIKSGITLKTFRVSKRNYPKEAISFENIDYIEVVKEDDWYNSRLYELFTNRFLFAVFKEYKENGTSVYRLEKCFFWTMPQNDLSDAEEYWKDIKKHVSENHVSTDYFYKEGDNKKFHVRPKAQKAIELAPTPSGTMAKKYCYWLNHSYIKTIIDTEFNQSNSKTNK